MTFPLIRKPRVNRAPDGLWWVEGLLRDGTREFPAYRAFLSWSEAVAFAHKIAVRRRA